MKSLNLYILLMCLSFTGWGKVITVDNNAGGGGDFNTIASAQNAATVGDTLHIIASPNSYGIITLEKRLVLIGPGHYPQGENFESARLETITMINGSSGSVISGLTIFSLVGASSHTVNNIQVINNKFLSSVAISFNNTEADNWVVSGNIFVEGNGCGGCILLHLANYTFRVNENWLITNNYIYTLNSNYIFRGINSSTVIENNLIVYDGTNSDQAMVYTAFNEPSSNAIFKNNIIIFTNSTHTDPAKNCTNCEFTNNLTYHTTTTMVPLPGTGNINDTDPQMLNANSKYTWTYQSDFNVKDSSPANNAGTDGKDLGLYGGGFSFSKNGYPPGLPYIEEFTLGNHTVTEGDNLIIKVKARAAAK